MTRTYLDSGVLIAICRGKSEVAQRAFTLVNDPDREIILSEAVRLEVMPRAIYEQRHDCNAHDCRHELVAIHI